MALYSMAMPNVALALLVAAIAGKGVLVDWATPIQDQTGTIVMIVEDIGMAISMSNSTTPSQMRCLFYKKK